MSGLSTAPPSLRHCDGSGGHSAAFREVTAQCGDSIKARSEHRKDDWCKQGGRVGNEKTEPGKLSTLCLLSCNQFSFALRRQGFFLIIASIEHISWLFGVVQSHKMFSLKTVLLGNEKVCVRRKPPFCFSLMPYCLSGTDNSSMPHAQYPCLEGRRSLVKSGTRLSSWLQRNKSSRRHCCQEQRGHGASQLSSSEWSSLFTRLLPSMLVEAPNIPPTFNLSLMSPQGC